MSPNKMHFQSVCKKMINKQILSQVIDWVQGNKLGILLLLLILNLSLVFSTPNSSNNSTCKQKPNYTPGFSIDIAAPDTTLTFGYFFGSNNTWEIYYRIPPYSSVNNLNGIEKDDSWSTETGGGINNFFSIARKKMNNQLFLYHYVDAGGYFGKSAENDAKIKSSYSLEYGGGLQYRLNENFYFKVSAPVVQYEQTKYSNTPNSLYPTNSTMWQWTILREGIVAVTYKF